VPQIFLQLAIMCEVGSTVNWIDLGTGQVARELDLTFDALGCEQ
jgi:hypothetical protein